MRNSGATAVVEGVGDHALEYMTGGTVAILGTTGRNLGAGMSGGVAFVIDLDPAKVNPEMVELEPVEGDDLILLEGVIRRHAEETESIFARELLDSWAASCARFTKVMPKDFKRVIKIRELAIAEGRDPLVAVMGG